MVYNHVERLTLQNNIWFNERKQIIIHRDGHQSCQTAFDDHNILTARLEI
jgi:hypothetical protein